MPEDSSDRLGHTVLRWSINKLHDDGVLPREHHDKLEAMCKAVGAYQRDLVEENAALRAVIRAARAVLREAE